MEVKVGRCLCGACSFELTGPHNWIGHCHSESCRRATASPVTTFLGHPDGFWRWTGETPRVYASSPGRKPGFCGTCGAQMFYVSDRFPDETHFYVALLDNPESVTPTQVYHAVEALCWTTAFDVAGSGRAIAPA